MCGKFFKGENFVTKRVREATDFTQEMLDNFGKGEARQFKKYNYNAQGPRHESGCLHPLLKVHLVAGLPRLKD